MFLWFVFLIKWFCRNSIDCLQKQLHDLEHELQEALETIAMYEQKISELHAKLRCCESAVEQLKKEIAARDRHIQCLEEANHELEHENQCLKETIEQLKAVIQSKVWSRDRLEIANFWENDKKINAQWWHVLILCIKIIASKKIIEFEKSIILIWETPASWCETKKIDIVVTWTYFGPFYQLFESFSFFTRKSQFYWFSLD